MASRKFNVFGYSNSNFTSQGSAIARYARPLKALEECYLKTKTKSETLVESMNQEELLLAIEIKLRKAGKKDSASIVRELSNASFKRGTLIKKARKSFLQKQGVLSADQALAMILDANLSIYQYNIIHQQVKVINNKLYPSYYVIQKAKQSCYPLEINITETSA